MPAAHPALPCGARAQLQLKFGQTGEHTGHHAARRVRGVDAFAEGPQHDPTLAKIADGHHHLSGVAAQAVNADHDDGIALPRVVQERSKAGTLLPR